MGRPSDEMLQKEVMPLCGTLTHLRKTRRWGTRARSRVPDDGQNQRPQTYFFPRIIHALVWSRVVWSDSLGTSVMKGFTIQPRPVGMSRVRLTASHCT